MEGFLEEGFSAVKIKVGREDPREDLHRVALVRRTVGDGVELMVDANMKWTAAEAIRMGKALEEFDVVWLEEPLIPDDIDGHRQVAQALTMRVAAGENLHTKYEFQRYLSAQALDVVQLDAITLGGITEWLKVAAMAEMHNLPITTHYAEELQVHLLAASPRQLVCRAPCLPPGPCPGAAIGAQGWQRSLLRKCRDTAWLSTWTSLVSIGSADHQGRENNCRK